MKLLGFNFTKLHAERLIDRSEGIKINTNIDISDIKEAKTDILKSEGKVIAVRFLYGVSYEPELAKIEIGGTIVLSVETPLGKEIIDQWEEKKVPEEFRINLFNLILKKSGLKAMQLEEELNLPLHIPFPSLKKSDSDKK